MITAEKAIEALQKRVNEITSISDVNGFNLWKKTTTSTLLNIFHNEDVRLFGMTSIKAYIRNNLTSGGTERLSAAKNEATTYLNGLIENIQDFGLPTPHKELSNNGLKFELNQHQHNNQHQTTNVKISIDVLFKELEAEIGRVGTRELKEILDGDGSPEEKKKSFFEKIKSFGSDVASNVLANILVNPQVYEQIGSMF
jgi:hypothetical protein